MTLLTPTDSITKRLTLPDSSEQAPKRAKVETELQCSTPKTSSFSDDYEALTHLPLLERGVDIQSEDIRIKIALTATENALEKADSFEDTLQVFLDIKKICTLVNGDQQGPTFARDIFAEHFKPLIEQSRHARFKYLSVTEFRLRIDSIEDEAISEMLGLWYNCTIKDNNDLNTFCQNASYIRKLSVSTTHNLTVEDIKLLAHVLERNQTLVNLNLGEMRMDDEAAEALAEVIKVNKTLRTLDLYENNITDRGVKSIALALEINTTLESLVLGAVEFKAEGAAALARALRKNQTLTKLALWSNKIKAAGASSLSAAFLGTQGNNTLTKLDLDSCKIGDTGAIILASALSDNHSLTKLRLVNNKIGIDGIVALAEALKKNKTLRHLDLSENSIRDDGAHAFVNTLEENNRLTHLYLDGKKIHQNTAIALAKALDKNKTLVHLDLGNVIMLEDVLQRHGDRVDYRMYSVEG